MHEEEDENYDNGDTDDDNYDFYYCSRNMKYLKCFLFFFGRCASEQ
jgi:hypothetical protein